MTLGEQIKAHREHRKLTLEQLRDLSGVDVGTISALENRKSKKSSFSAAIAKGLGITHEQLMMPPDAVEPPEPVHVTPKSPGLRYLLLRLGEHLAKLDAVDREAAIPYLKQLALSPDRAETVAEKLERLLGESGPAAGQDDQQKAG